MRSPGSRALLAGEQPGQVEPQHLAAGLGEKVVAGDARGLAHHERRSRRNVAGRLLHARPSRRLLHGSRGGWWSEVVRRGRGVRRGRVASTAGAGASTGAAAGEGVPAGAGRDGRPPRG